MALKLSIKHIKCMMASQWYLGRVANFWCGMPLAQTCLYLPTLLLPSVGQVQWQHQAEERKCSKACHLDVSHIFAPVAIETSGTFRPWTTEFLRELGHHLRLATGESKDATYLLQHLSVAIQRGNAASVMGSISHSAALHGDFS